MRSGSAALLVTVQIGLALMLLIGAALMGNSLLKLLNNELGADPKNLLTFEFRFPQDELMRPVDKYRGVGLWEIFPVSGLTFERMWDRVQQIPGVRSAAAISRAPLSGNAMGMQFFVEGQPRPESGRGQSAAYFAITPRYFETMKIPILRGRDFTRTDTATAPLVMIINKTMADRFWEGKDPIGQHVTLDFVPNEQPRVIVGVVADSVIGRFQRQPTPFMYVPHLQQQNRWQGPAWDYRAMMAFVIRTDGDPMALAPAVRRAVADIDRGKPAGNIRTVEQYLGQQARGMELYATLLGIFGGGSRSARGPRHLRRDGLHGRAADARDRDQDGARGRRLTRHAAGDRTRADSDRHRARAGTGRGDGVDPRYSRPSCTR